MMDRERTVRIMTVLIDAHIRRLRAAGRSRHTIRQREELLWRADEELPEGLIHATTEEIETWFTQARTRAGHPWSRVTRGIYFAGLNAFYEQLCSGRDPILSYNPMADMPRPSVPPGLPRPAVTLDLAQAVARAERPWRTAVLLSMYGGLRAGEVALIERDDLLGDELRILGKGSKERLVPNHPLIRAEAAHLPPGVILVGVHGHPLGDEAASRVSKYLTSIGLPGVTLHRCRHWYATQLVRAGVDIRVVQVLLGHANLSMTARYVEVSGEQRRRAVSALPTLAVPS